MKLIFSLFFLCSIFFAQAQLKFKFKQYMLHQTVYNPGFVDVQTKYSINSLYRRQWLRRENYPEAFLVYGHYNLSRNHGFGLILANDLINKYNQFEIGANYVYNIPIADDYNLGLGVKLGFIEQNYLPQQFTYFDPIEPVLAENSYTSRFINVGTGISFTSRDLSVHFGLPQLLGNRFINSNDENNIRGAQLFTNIGYKFRSSDWFLVYPNMMLYVVKGSKYHGSFHVNFLSGQLVWYGIGMDTDYTMNACVGLFIQSGFRVVYSVDNRFFPVNQTTGVSHEISVSYAKSIKDNPFSKRRSGGFRKSGIRWR